MVDAGDEGQSSSEGSDPDVASRPQSGHYRGGFVATLLIALSLLLIALALAMVGYVVWNDFIDTRPPVIQANVSIAFDDANHTVTITHHGSADISDDGVNVEYLNVTFGNEGNLTKAKLVRNGDSIVVGPDEIHLIGGARVYGIASPVAEGDDVHVTVTAVKGDRSTVIRTESGTL